MTVVFHILIVKIIYPSDPYCMNTPLMNNAPVSVKSVESVQKQNLICLLDIDIQGAQNVKKSTLDAYYLFIAPPSMEELEKRLRGRKTDSEEAMQRRLANAKGELEYGMQKGNFDAVLVNNDLDEALKEMVGNFEGWFPDLLSRGAMAENGEQALARAQDATYTPPPILDPLSFPKTDEGLTELLTAVDTNTCPLESYVQTELTYQASDVYVAAGKQLSIQLPPVEQDGSKIDWNVTVVDRYNERLDVDFGLFVIVGGEEVAAREMGRIVSPVTNSNDAVTDDTTESSSPTTGVSAKGKFTVANSAPVFIIMKLDNSYSWIKPKEISYSFHITSPVDENMKERSLRAKSVMPKILEGHRELLQLKGEEAARKEALGRRQSEMEEILSGLDEKIVKGKQTIKLLKTRILDAEEEAQVKVAEIKEALSAVKREEQSMKECTTDILALENECARLKKKWEELKVERQVREEEKLEKEKEAERNKEQRVGLQEEITAKKAEEQNRIKDIEEVENERSLLLENLADLGREKKAKEEAEGKHGEALKFMQKMLDAVKLRLIEPQLS